MRTIDWVNTLTNSSPVAGRDTSIQPVSRQQTLRYIVIGSLLSLVLDMFRDHNFMPSAHSELQKMGEGDELQCSVCGCEYTVKRRDPRLLRCLHAVCEPCLKTRDASSLVCDTCNTEEAGKDGTPVDYVRLNEHILFIAKHNPDRLKCTNQNDGKNGRMYCFECNHFLCDQCVGYHSQLEATKNHLSVYLGDLTSHPLTEWQTKEKCSTHPDYPVSFFCHEASCRKLICLYCFTKGHSGHNAQEIDEAYELEKETLKELSQRLEERISSHRQTLSKQRRSESLRRQVYATFDKLRNEVSERHRYHQQILDFHYGEFKQTSLDQVHHLQQVRDKLRQFYHTAMAFAGNPQFNEMEENVHNFERMKAEDDAESQSSGTDLVFVQVGLSNILKDIESFGGLKEGSVATPQE